MSKPLPTPEFVSFYQILSMDKTGNFGIAPNPGGGMMFPNELSAQQVATLERIRDPGKVYQIFEISWPTNKAKE